MLLECGKKVVVIQDHAGDLDIETLVDCPDALSEQEYDRIMKLVNSDRSLRKKYDALIGQKDLLQRWWRESKTALS